MVKIQKDIRKSMSSSLLRTLALTTLVTTTLSVALPALAADKGTIHPPMAEKTQAKMSPALMKQIDAFKKARSEMLHARGRLENIQNAAFKAHPELHKQQKAFLDLLSKTMKKYGYNIKMGIPKLKSIRSKLQDKKTPQSAKRKLVKQYQVEVAKLNKAQGKALQDKEVQNARKSLQNAIITAMRKQDPNTDKLIAMVQRKQNELQKIRQTVFEQMQHNRNKSHVVKHSQTK